MWALLVPFLCCIYVKAKITECPEQCKCWPNENGELTVDCRYQNLVKVPSFAKETCFLFLQGNFIKEVAAENFALAPTLRNVDLSRNVINRIEEGAFSRLPLLENISLDYNKLNFRAISSVPCGVLDMLASLKQLHIHDNVWRNLTEYRGDLLRHKTRLEVLSLDSPLGDVPLPAEFAGLKALRSLTLYGGIQVIGNGTLSILETIPVENLTFAGGNVERIDVMAFTHMHSMMSLNLSHNQRLTLETITPGWISALSGLNETKIKQLYLQNIVNRHYGILPSTFFDYLKSTTLTELYLDNNGLKYHGDNYALLAHLTKLSLTSNRLAEYLALTLREASLAPNLRYLDISKQSVLYTTRNGTRNIQDQSEYLVLSLSRKLTTLRASVSVDTGHLALKRVIFFTQTKRMDVIDISQNYFGNLQASFVFGNIREIDFLNLSTCSFNELPDPLFPRNCSVKRVDLSKNNLGDIIGYDHNGSVLARFQNSDVEEIDLSGNGIKSLADNFFSKIRSLEIVYLRRNSLQTWNSTLKTLTKLTHLDLSHNLLSVLAENICAELDEFSSTRHVSFDMTGNPLECQCYNLDFLKWLRTTTVQIVNRDNYTCHFGEGLVTFSNLTSIVRELTIRCSSKAWVTYTVLTLALMIVAMFLSVLLYRHRWDIRYFCLRLVRQRREDQHLNRERDYEFDVFVAYHQEDVSWVIRMLMVRLESGNPPLKLCLHHRNWLPGPTIEENISRSVEVSRKTLVVLTKNFLRSGWCELEMQLARMRGLEEGEEVIVVVALEEIPLRQMSSTLVNLRRTNTWLDWYEYENEREFFWNLLRQALGPPNSSTPNHDEVVSEERGDGSDEELVSL